MAPVMIQRHDFRQGHAEAHAGYNQHDEKYRACRAAEISLLAGESSFLAGLLPAGAHVHLQRGDQRTASLRVDRGFHRLRCDTHCGHSASHRGGAKPRRRNRGRLRAADQRFRDGASGHRPDEVPRVHDRDSGCRPIAEGHIQARNLADGRCNRALSCSSICRRKRIWG